MDGDRQTCGVQRAWVPRKGCRLDPSRKRTDEHIEVWGFPPQVWQTTGRTIGKICPPRGGVDSEALPGRMGLRSHPSQRNKIEL